MLRCQNTEEDTDHPDGYMQMGRSCDWLCSLSTGAEIKN